MTDHLEKSVDTALAVTAQLITLATALIPITVALVELRYPGGTKVPSEVVLILVAALVVDVISIGFGVAVYAAVTDSLRLTKDMNVIYQPGPRYTAMGQWFAFVIGACLTVTAAIVAIC